MYKQQSTMKKNRAQQQHTFSVAETGVSRERSTFSRPSRTITAIDAGFLYPVLVDEVLPGDTFSMRMEMLGWLATPLRPFLDNLYVDSFFFFVPNRIVWDNWTKFQGEQIDPGDSISFTVPQIDIAGGSTAGANKLADYMGIATIATSFEVNALPFRGYNLIWNDFFRDQNLQDSVTNDKGDTNSTEANHVLLKRGKRKDYITGSVPWPQKGATAVSLPLGTTAPVLSLDTAPVFTVDGTNTFFGTATGGGTTWTTSADPVGTGAIKFDDTGPLTTGLVTDLTNATAATVNALREAIAIQQLLELDARSGTRHPEQLKARFGVTSSDFRLQRPEYLGGGHQNIAVSPVPGTNQNPTPQDVGRLGGFGQVRGPAGGFTHSFTEHGYVICLISMRADYTYFEGIPRHWRRTTRYDYYEPALAHLGEQAVLNSEVFVSNDSNDDLTWGFQERFSEYKYGNSMVTSVMRPNHPATLSQWHLAEQFSTLPNLGDTFIQENPPVDRVISVDTEPHLLVDCYFTSNTTRVMPVFNTPGLRRL